MGAYRRVGKWRKEKQKLGRVYKRNKVSEGWGESLQKFDIGRLNCRGQSIKKKSPGDKSRKGLWRAAGGKESYKTRKE